MTVFYYLSELICEFTSCTFSAHHLSAPDLAFALRCGHWSWNILSLSTGNNTLASRGRRRALQEAGASLPQFWHAASYSSNGH